MQPFTQSNSHNAKVRRPTVNLSLRITDLESPLTNYLNNQCIKKLAIQQLWSSYGLHITRIHPLWSWMCSGCSARPSAGSEVHLTTILAIWYLWPFCGDRQPQKNWKAKEWQESIKTLRRQGRHATKELKSYNMWQGYAPDCFPPVKLIIAQGSPLTFLPPWYSSLIHLFNYKWYVLSSRISQIGTFSDPSDGPLSSPSFSFLFLDCHVLLLLISSINFSEEGGRDNLMC